MRRTDRPSRPPRDELPVVLPTETIVAKSPVATFAVTAINVYSECCLLALDWVLRRQPDAEWTREQLEAVLLRPFGRPSTAAEAAVAGGRIHYSAEFSDGTRPLIQDAGGGTASSGAGRACYGQSHLFLWPLPPPGKLRLTLSWPSFGIRNAVTAFDATAIHEAARRVRQL